MTPSRSDFEAARMRDPSGTRRLRHLTSPVVQMRIRLHFRRRQGKRAERKVFP